ncbi:MULTISPECIES: hypothetical protein [Allobranchiibius]|uniref:Uncharacterized protein n=1 Tax=Allobranchiibius huperziae TaxID=1874116 RepID=A0A853DAT5_9MICO|nr:MULTISPECIES: hypothetical protein [Allobranchiibius]MBO1766409.1 hypothetical protein [Allobranchiibius sp. GilTou38]NYJ74636.1 hypothetical protein [Allobranchiibius huperziae]
MAVDERSHVRRRAVIAGALWTAPVILIGAPAPAEAASTSVQPAQLAFNTLNTTGTAYNGSGKPTGLQTQVQVQNVYYASYPSVSASVQKLTVVVRFPSGQVSTAAPTAVSGTGWAFTSVATSGGNRVFTFTWTGAMDPGQQTSSLEFTVAMSNTNSGQRTLTATASATNATDANGSASYTVN